MEYPKNGYSVPTDKAALDDALYALVKRLKSGSAKQAAMFLDRANELIAAGADLDQTGRPKGSLLAVMLSSHMTDHKEAIFQTMLEHGANPNAPVSGLSMFVGEERGRYTSLAQVAVSEMMMPTACCRLITLLAKHGGDLNTKTRNGYTALDIAMCRLWEWEDRFETNRAAGARGPYNLEIANGFVLISYAPPFLKLVETVVELGGLPSLWTEAQVKNCRERMPQIIEGCWDVRQEGFAKAEAADMEPRHYFATTELGNDAKSIARMAVGEPTPPLVLHKRKGPKSE